MKQPVDHILRPILPWRDPSTSITECGLAAAEIKTITRAEFIQRRKDLGTQRAAMFTCMTCAQTSDRWCTWEADPRLVMSREIEWERGSAYWSQRDDRGQRLKDELLAIGGLIEAHRDEFETALQTAQARREWNDKKAAMGRSQ